MKPKPKHLDRQYAEQFQDQSVADAYGLRPPYPAEVFQMLAGLIQDEPRAALDVGCGQGEIARPLLAFVERVDAVDFSAAMIAKGRTLPGGTDPRLHWILGAVEEAPLQPPYALITAGASLHWMDWEVVLPRFHQMLTPHGYLALIGVGINDLPWNQELQRLIDRYSTNRDYQPYSLISELESRGLFHKVGEQHTAPVPFVQPIEDYVQSIHARNGFSRERMSAEAARAYDSQARQLVERYCPHGEVELQVSGVVVWGKPA